MIVSVSLLGRYGDRWAIARLF